MHLNAQSFLCNKYEIVRLVDEVQPYILCLSETRVTEDVLNVEVDIKNYECVRCNSENRYTGGVLVFIRKDVNFEIVNIISKVKNYWVAIIKTALINIVYYVITIYHSPSGNTSQFLDWLENYFEDMWDKNFEVIIVGDFNINMLDKQNRHTKRLDNFLNSFSLQQVVQQPTRITPRGATLIDLVIINNYNNKITAGIYDKTKITDHEIVRINFEKNKNIQPFITSVIKRDFSKAKLDQIKIALIECEWGYDSSDINVLYDIFETNIIKLLDKYCPKRCIKFKPKSSPWIDINIQNLCKERNKAYTNFKLTKNEEDWKIYKNKRNQVVATIRKQKIKFYENSIDRNKGNSKKMWQTLKNLISTKKADKGSGKLCVDKNIYKLQTDADNFNHYFIKSIDDIVVQNNFSAKWNANELPVIESSLSVFDTVTLSQLKTIVMGLKNKAGVNELNTFVLKELFDVVGYPILNLINMSLTEGVMPDSLKISTVIPIPKINCANKLEDYRGINMLPIVEKLIEIVVHSQILNYMETNNLLFERQSGFRKNHSCETAVQLVVNEWKKSIDKDQYVAALFIDFKRAFETISRTTLLNKLNYYGIKGVVLNWFQSYLSNRYQITKYDSTTSVPLKNLHGVPQGSVLGPLLFIIYINDIHKVINKCSIKLFADDTLLYSASEDPTISINAIKADLKTLIPWLGKNDVFLNVDKTKAIMISTKPNLRKINLENFKLSINKKTIQWVTQIKYLGIIIDKNLNFNIHFEEICKKLSKKIGFLRRVSKDVSLYTRIIIYNTVIRPHYQYCCTILYLLNTGQKNKLQVLQNRAMRSILKCNKYTPINSMLSVLNWLSIIDLINYYTMIFIHKIKIRQYPNYLEISKNREIHSYPTKSSNHFRLERYNKQATKHSVFYEGVKAYNSLPVEITNAQTIKQFKRKYLKHIQEK